MDTQDQPEEFLESAEAEVATGRAGDPYVPSPREQRKRTALCLSGGGFRAALFHLGALRRLNELGVLSRLDTISCVSGGSIFAAFMAQRILPMPPDGEALPGWEERVGAPFRAFVAADLRTLPLLRRLLPWNWGNEEVSVESLRERLHERVTDRTLGQLPDRPRLVFSATDMAYGVNWTFQKGRVGDYQAGYLRPASGYPVARAVAASCCFPPFFAPMRAAIEPDRLTGGKARKDETREELVRGLRLTDGGVYDNMGLEPVWKTHRTVLTSDGGATFDPGLDRGPILRLSRYHSLLGKQSLALRKRWLIASFKTGAMEGTYWGVGSTARHYDSDAPGYSEELVAEIISEVRTDMDAFSPAEIAVLENHGYLLADAAIARHAPHLPGPHAPAPAVPHPEWMEESRVRAALAGSHKVRLLGRRRPLVHRAVGLVRR